MAIDQKTAALVTSINDAMATKLYTAKGVLISVRGKTTDLGNVTGNVNVNIETANEYYMTVTGNGTLVVQYPTYTAPPDNTGSTYTTIINITNGGAFTFNLPGNAKFPDGVRPTLSVSGTDKFLMYWDWKEKVPVFFTIGQNIR